MAASSSGTRCRNSPPARRRRAMRWYAARSISTAGCGEVRADVVHFHTFVTGLGLAGNLRGEAGGQPRHCDYAFEQPGLPVSAGHADVAGADDVRRHGGRAAMRRVRTGTSGRGSGRCARPRGRAGLAGRLRATAAGTGRDRDGDDRSHRTQQSPAARDARRRRLVRGADTARRGYRDRQRRPPCESGREPSRCQRIDRAPPATDGAASAQVRIGYVGTSRSDQGRARPGRRHSARAA